MSTNEEILWLNNKIGMNSIQQTKETTDTAEVLLNKFVCLFSKKPQTLNVASSSNMNFEFSVETEICCETG